MSLSEHDKCYAGRNGWQTCTACDGRIHGNTCTSKENHLVDCCEKRHKRMGLPESSAQKRFAIPNPPGTGRARPSLESEAPAQGERDLRAIAYLIWQVVFLTDRFKDDDRDLLLAQNCPVMQDLDNYFNKYPWNPFDKTVAREKHTVNAKAIIELSDKIHGVARPSEVGELTEAELLEIYHHMLACIPGEKVPHQFSEAVYKLALHSLRSKRKA